MPKLCTKTLPGWKQSTVGITRFEDLPRQTPRSYLDRLQSLVGVPITMISTGTGSRSNHHSPESIRLIPGDVAGFDVVG